MPQGRYATQGPSDDQEAPRVRQSAHELAGAGLVVDPETKASIDGIFSGQSRMPDTTAAHIAASQAHLTAADAPGVSPEESYAHLQASNVHLAAAAMRSRIDENPDEIAAVENKAKNIERGIAKGRKTGDKSAFLAGLQRGDPKNDDGRWVTIGGNRVYLRD